MDGVSSGDVWAVGYSRRPSRKDQPLIEHWGADGAWRQVDFPAPGPPTGLGPVEAIASDDVWSAGDFISRFGREVFRFVHWDGSTWSVVPGPPLPTNESFFVGGLSATGPSDLWAVGFSDEGTLTMHRPGTGFLYHVAAVADDDLWAAGDIADTTGTTRTLILHWDGVTWSQVHSANTSRPEDQLIGITANVAAGEVWAVGFSARGRTRTLIERTCGI